MTFPKQNRNKYEITKINHKSDSFENTFKEESDRLFQYASYRFAEIADAEDAVHDLFLALSAKKETLRDVDNLRAYMFRSLINLCNERIRAKRQTISVTDFDELDIQYRLCRRPISRRSSD